MRFFLAGIMQGSLRDQAVHEQGYRTRLKQVLARNFPEAEVYDPWADHSDSLAYDDETGRRVFFHHNRLCGQVDVVIAFVPEASMGTAIEMWEAYRQGRKVVCISGLSHNWAVRFLSHLRFADLAEFETAVATGLLRRQLEGLAPAALDADRPTGEAAR